MRPLFARLVTLCIVALVLFSGYGKCDEALHLKPEIAAYFSDIGVSVIEELVNEYDLSYRKSRNAGDPTILGDVYDEWSKNLESVGGLSISDPDEVTNLKFNLYAVFTDLTFASLVKNIQSLNDALGTAHSLGSDMITAAKMLDIEKTMSEDRLTEENVLQKYWDFSGAIHSRVIEDFQ